VKAGDLDDQAEFYLIAIKQKQIWEVLLAKCNSCWWIRNKNEGHAKYPSNRMCAKRASWGSHATSLKKKLEETLCKVVEPVSSRDAEGEKKDERTTLSFRA